MFYFDTIKLGNKHINTYIFNIPRQVKPNMVKFGSDTEKKRLSSWTSYINDAHDSTFGILEITTPGDFTALALSGPSKL